MGRSPVFPSSPLLLTSCAVLTNVSLYVSDTLSLPHQLMIFNASATVLYITAFITCSASVNLTSLKGSRQYNQHAAASVSMAPRAPQAVCRYQDSSHQEPASSPRVSEGGRLLLASLINSKTLGNWDTWGVRKTWG